MALMPLAVACQSKTTSFDGDDGGGNGNGDADGGFGGGSSGGGSSGSGGQFNSGDGGGGGGSSADDGNCKGGLYTGSFGGLYASSLLGFGLGIGINVPVTGNLQLTLHQEGTGQSTCTVQGESEECSDVFSLQNGSISGTADGLVPFYCAMTGTLECKEKELVGGWIQCVYCTGTLADGGAPDGGLPACSSGSGYFAGQLTADYFYGVDGGVPSFGTQPPPAGNDPGSWNGAESLAGYSGTGPLPDGGTLGDYISDAGYGMIGSKDDFGGDGWWYATYQGQ